MKKIHTDCCPVCGNERLAIFLHVKDHFATSQFFDLVKCKACGFVLTQDFPASNDIAPYYNSTQYISHSDSEKGLMNKIYKLVRSWMLKSKTHLVETASGIKAGNLLEVGCGTGYFSGAMKQRGWKVTAIEKIESARRFAQATWGIDVMEADTLEHIPSHSQDVIALWHVLEHIENLNETMKHFDRILTQKGTLVLALPNCNSYDAEMYGPLWAAYDVPRHLWHFTPNTISRLAGKHGFDLVKKQNMPFDVFYISLISQRYKGGAFGLFKAMKIAVKGWALSLTDVEQASSVIYVFKKR